MDLGDPITGIKGVGEVVGRNLNQLGIKTVDDLFNYYPRKYEDYSDIVTIAKARPGTVSIKATINHITSRYSHRGLHITEAIATDKTGSMRLIWFNQSYRAGSLKADEDYFIAGEFGLHRQHMGVVNPSIEQLSSFPINTARIIPVYKENRNLKSNQIRNIIKNAIPYFSLVKEELPAWLVKDYKLMDRSKAVSSIHFPDSVETLDAARHRLGFEEVFELNLAALLNKKDLAQTKALAVPFDQKLAQSFVKNLPFKLTDEQRQVAWQIYLDMQETKPMNRLVEGDVGTGKTVVATMAAVMVVKQGFQVAYMAPTEILARQHAETIYKLLEPLGMADQLTVLTGSHSAAQKKVVLERLKSGNVNFIIGTHSLIQENIKLPRLGLVIIDEQHRFGVKQRQALQMKTGHMPHILSMTATPIPRSLQLTLYGELDVSIIRHKPYTQKAVITKLYSRSQRTQLYESLKVGLKKGQQMFIVCPLIATSNDLAASAAETVYEELSKGIFKEFKMALLHSKLKTELKVSIIDDFSKRKIDILVATTIIEVGVNIPNANIMVIESAERFGLAQIHQLRGRVGRSDEQGYCYLMLDNDDKPNKRLRALESSSDGFKLAELDLEIRGPGAIYGTMQHGLLDLRIAQLTDQELIRVARSAAQNFIDKEENLVSYKYLNGRISRLRAVTNLN
jgi:ATP-dependent DNA helicase RecG